jgi:hypothetical protein
MQMGIVIVTSAIGCSALLLALFVVIRKIGFSGSHLPVTAEWIDELSIERYRPMARLLDGDDLEFLRSQPGFTPKMLDNVRAQRCQIFRGYLRCLQGDFGRVCSAIKLVMLQSSHDRPDLAAALIRHQLTFATGMMSVYCRLALYSWGICGVDIARLVKSFDTMRLELRTLIPATAPMGA